MTPMSKPVPRVLSRFVARLGALPSDVVELLTAPQTIRQLNLLDNHNRSLDTEGARLSQALYEWIGTLTDSGMRNSFLRLRRDIFNGRAPRMSLSGEVPVGIREQFKSWNSRRLERDLAVGSLRSTFAEEQRAARGAMQTLITSGDFLNGLLLSSRTLHDNVAKFRSARLDKWTARLEQIERGLLRYLTRTAMKATPFATFCTVVPARITLAPDDVGAVRILGDLETTTSFVRLNKNIFGLLWEALKNDPATRAEFVVNVNPTLAEDSAGYRFLAVVEGREVFQRLSPHPVLPFLLSLVRSADGERLSALVSALGHEPTIEADAGEATAFLEYLIRIGLLHFCSDVAEQDVGWDETLIGALRAVDTERSRRTTRLLESIRLKTVRYASADAHARVSILSDIRSIIQNEFEASPTPWGLRGETPIYEDATADAEVEIAADSSVRNAIDCFWELASLVARLGSPRIEQATMRHVFDQLYARETAVPLLTVYEDYYREHFKAHLGREAEARRGVIPSPQESDLYNPFELDAILRLGLPRFNGRVSDRNYAAACSCCSYSAGLMYPSVEWRRFRLYHVSMYRKIARRASSRVCQSFFMSNSNSSVEKKLSATALS